MSAVDLGKNIQAPQITEPLQLAMPCQLLVGAIPGTGINMSLTSYEAQFSLVMVSEIVIWVLTGQKQ